MNNSILKVLDLTVDFDTSDGVVHAIEKINFNLKKGETLAIIGESGSGKSVTASVIMGILSCPPGKIRSGSVFLNNQDILLLDQIEKRKLMGDKIAIIFQDSLSHLNPVFNVGSQIAECFKIHKKLSKKEAWANAISLLDKVKIPNPSKRAKDYPHQFSGGQRQRVMIAMALACEPKILVADEPTTALDVTVQAQIFDLLKELRVKTNTAIILITHDMGVVYEMAQKMIVMYAGRKVEEGSVNQVIKSPAHPYTQGLISCVPHLTEKQPDVRERLLEIPGIVPSLTSFGLNKCLFESRCHKSVEKCLSSKPDSQSISSGHQANCWNLGK